MSLETLITDAIQLNSWHQPRVLRQYQWEMITIGYSVGSSGAVFRAAESRGCYALFSETYPGAALLTAGLGTAYGITHIVFNGRVYGLIGATVFEVSETSPAIDLVALAQMGPDHGTRHRSRVLRIGHPNFAHFLWNQLPALIEHETILAELIERGDLLLVLEPQHREVIDALGGVGRLLPELDGNFHDTQILDSPSVPFGSTLVTRVTQQRVKEGLSRPSDLEVEGPVLWVSVRPPPRSPSNQVEFLVEVVDRWCTSSGGSVIVDGFAVTRSFQSHHRARIAETDALVEAIFARVGKGRARQRVRTTLNMDLAAVLTTAGLADCYVSPEGTVQHKVGWVWNKPGVIHIGPRPFRDAAVRWHGLQIEGGVDPLSLPLDYVEGFDASGSYKEPAPDSREINYSIRPQGVAAEWIVDQLSATTFSSDSR